jgi:hypothetical protein
MHLLQNKLGNMFQNSLRHSASTHHIRLTASLPHNPALEPYLKADDLIPTIPQNQNHGNENGLLMQRLQKGRYRVRSTQNMR